MTSGVYNAEMAFKVPPRLRAQLPKLPERAAWLERLPGTLRSLEHRWQ
jgi:hypothetical protein